ALDAFFKHVTQFPTAVVDLGVTVPGVVDTAAKSNNVGNPALFSESTYSNAGEADVHGIEFTVQQMLPYGFGFQINGTYVASNANFNNNATVSNQFALPGVGNSANLVAFYQNYGLQARLAVQWQGTQLLQLGQQQTGGAFGAEPVYLAANTELDF